MLPTLTTLITTIRIQQNSGYKGDEDLIMNVIKLIRRSTEKTLQDAVDFNSLYSACSKAINETLKTFPNSVTENLNESELLALYVMNTALESELHTSPSDISTPDVKKKEFIELVKHKYILEGLELDFTLCAIFMCSRVFGVRKLTGEKFVVAEGKLLRDICSYVRTIENLPKFMCECGEDAYKELCTWCAKNKVSMSKKSLEDLLWLYIDDLLSKDIVNWYKPDTNFIYTVFNWEPYIPESLLEIMDNIAIPLSLESIKRDRYPTLEISPKLDYALYNKRMHVATVVYTTISLFDMLVGDTVVIDLLYKGYIEPCLIAAFTHHYVSSINFDDQYKIDQIKRRI